MWSQERSYAQTSLKHECHQRHSVFWGEGCWRELLELEKPPGEHLGCAHHRLQHRPHPRHQRGPGAQKTGQLRSNQINTSSNPHLQRFSLFIISLAITDLLCGIFIPFNTLRVCRCVFFLKLKCCRYLSAKQTFRSWCCLSVSQLVVTLKSM